MAVRLAGGETRRYSFYVFAGLCVFAAIKSGLETGSPAGPILFGFLALCCLAMASVVNRGPDTDSEEPAEPLTPAKVALLLIILIVMVGQFIWRILN